MTARLREHICIARDTTLAVVLYVCMIAAIMVTFYSLWYVGHHILGIPSGMCPHCI